MPPTAMSESAPRMRVARATLPSVVIAAAGRRGSLRRRRALVGPRRHPHEVGALEVIREAIALELAGTFFGEGVQRQALVRQLGFPIGTVDDAEIAPQR